MIMFVMIGALSGLFHYAQEAVTSALSPVQIGVLVACILGLAVVEGWWGFHRNFAPLVGARLLHLMRYPHPNFCVHVLLVLFLPFYAFALFYAPVHRFVRSWLLVTAVMGLVIGVHYLDQPWRGIVDAGVVVGLGLGTLSIAYFGGGTLANFPNPFPAHKKYQDSAAPLWVDQYTDFQDTNQTNAPQEQPEEGTASLTAPLLNKH
jgi:hypothetical protein